jgi:stringent starvation protein B
LLPPKKEVALALLERSNVDVYLDPRSKGVVVPPQFRKEPRLILKIGLNMPVPIPDLRLDDESMSCTLSFSRSPFFCVVPWESVFAMVGDDGRGMVWPDDVPQELAVRVVEEKRTPSDRESGMGGPVAVPTPTSPRRRSVKEAKDAKDAKDRAAAESGSTDVPADRPSRGKKSKKKKDEEKRPVLMAVPTPTVAERPEKVEKLEKLEKVAVVPPAARSPQAPPPSARGAGGGSNGPPSQRPKRELPPYLRVVK